MTMTDNLTGLIWDKMGGSHDVKTWQEALAYANSLNIGSGYLGHTDWRLPNRNEMESLINKGEAVNGTWLTGQGFSDVQGYY